MYSLDVGIENLLDNGSRTTVLPKLYFDSLKMIHCDLGVSVLLQCERIHGQCTVSTMSYK